MVQSFPSSHVKAQNEAPFLLPTPQILLGTKTLTSKATGYAVITNDFATSNLNVATTFGHVTVAITTKARVAERNSSHVTRKW
jgi:hypothetical protein